MYRGSYVSDNYCLQAERWDLILDRVLHAHAPLWSIQPPIDVQVTLANPLTVNLNPDVG
jgi:hypothetical protein